MGNERVYIKLGNSEFPIRETRTFVLECTSLTSESTAFASASSGKSCLDQIMQLTVAHRDLGFKSAVEDNLDCQITDSDSYIILNDPKVTSETPYVQFKWLLMFWKQSSSNNVYISSLAGSTFNNLTVLNGFPITRSSGFVQLPANSSLQVQTSASLFCFGFVKEGTTDTTSSGSKQPLIDDSYSLETILADLNIILCVQQLKSRVSTLKVQTVVSRLLSNIVYTSSMDPTLLQSMAARLLGDPFLFKKASHHNQRVELDKEYTMRPAPLIAAANSVTSPATALLIEVSGTPIAARESLLFSRLRPLLQQAASRLKLGSNTPPLSPYMQACSSPLAVKSATGFTHQPPQYLPTDQRQSPVFVKTPFSSANHSRRSSAASATMFLRPTHVTSSNPLSAFHFDLLPEMNSLSPSYDSKTPPPILPLPVSQFNAPESSVTVGHRLPQYHTLQKVSPLPPQSSPVPSASERH